MAARGELTELQLRVRQLAEQVQQIQREPDDQRTSSSERNDFVRSTNTWIFWWAVVRSVYVVAAVTWMSNTW